MTIEQIKDIEELIEKRNRINEIIKNMQNIYAVDFYKSCQEQDPIRFMEFNNTDDFFAVLRTGAVKTARESVMIYMMGERDKITAKLKELGLEE